MADASGLDVATSSLIRFAVAVATGQRDALQATAGELVDCETPDAWVDELVLQSVLMVGWPKALMAMGVWRSISGRPPPEDDIDRGYGRHDAWTARGEETCRAVYGTNYEKLRANVCRLHPALDAWMLTEGYGRTLSRPGLDLVRRELCTVAQTAVLDTPHQLHSHLRGALNVGATDGQIEAVLQLVESELSPPRRTEVRTLWREIQQRATDAD